VDAFADWGIRSNTVFASPNPARLESHDAGGVALARALHPLTDTIIAIGRYSLMLMKSRHL
jgi:hypothetical protein